MSEKLDEPWTEAIPACGLGGNAQSEAMLACLLGEALMEAMSACQPGKV